MPAAGESNAVCPVVRARERQQVGRKVARLGGSAARTPAFAPNSRRPAYLMALTAAVSGQPRPRVTWFSQQVGDNGRWGCFFRWVFEVVPLRKSNIQESILLWASENGYSWLLVKMFILFFSSVAVNCCWVDVYVCLRLTVVGWWFSGFLSQCFCLL